MTQSPCEYCGAPLPKAVDKASRRVRSAHFEAHARERREAQSEPAGLPALLQQYHDGTAAKDWKAWAADVVALLSDER